MHTDCIIDLIIEKKEIAFIVYEDKDFIAFLDRHPLFFGHTLVAPKHHYKTLYELPPFLINSLFLLIQQMGTAIEQAVQAEGSFVAINNTISQSIPHLHVHVVPRNKKDGLRGFFWPRKRYESDAQMYGVQEKIIHQLNEKGLMIKSDL